MTKRRLKSRKPLVIEAQGLLAQNTNAPTWIHNTGKENWTKNISRLHSFITDVGPLPTSHELSWLPWVRMKRLRTGIARFGSLMYNIFFAKFVLLAAYKDAVGYLPFNEAMSYMNS